MQPLSRIIFISVQINQVDQGIETKFRIMILCSSMCLWINNSECISLGIRLISLCLCNSGGKEDQLCHVYNLKRPVCVCVAILMPWMNGTCNHVPRINLWYNIYQTTKATVGNLCSNYCMRASERVCVSALIIMQPSNCICSLKHVLRTLWLCLWSRGTSDYGFRLMCVCVLEVSLFQ